MNMSMKNQADCCHSATLVRLRITRIISSSSHWLRFLLCPRFYGTTSWFPFSAVQQEDWKLLDCVGLFKLIEKQKLSLLARFGLPDSTFPVQNRVTWQQDNPFFSRPGDPIPKVPVVWLPYFLPTWRTSASPCTCPEDRGITHSEQEQSVLQARKQNNILLLEEEKKC